MPSRRLGGRYDSQRGGRKQKRQTGAQTQKQQATNRQTEIQAACRDRQIDRQTDCETDVIRWQKVALHPLLSTRIGSGADLRALRQKSSTSVDTAVNTVIACLYISCDCISARPNSRDPLSASFRLQKVALHPLLSTRMVHFLSPPLLQLNRVSYFLIALLPANFPYMAPCASSPLLTPSCVSAVCGQMWGWTLAPECLDVPCEAQAWFLASS